MKRTFFNKWIFISFLLVLSSCSAPGDKQDYLNQFEHFVSRVEQNYENYKKSDWEWANERYYKFSNEWYDRYKKDLTSLEHIKVAELKLRFRQLKTESSLQKLKQALKEGAADAKKDLQEYLRNEADEDLENLAEGARAIGDSAVKVLKDVIQTIKKEKKQD